jgi:histidine ammonia-lyase
LRLLDDRAMSPLPNVLIADPETKSGLMVAQYMSASVYS